ncbi:MAG: HAMP domain-containing protein [Deltaproteobacteria bacterium]|nr:MAG: HAMP domain-containing protein [Deltaproteobacteria bacterium]
MRLNLATKIVALCVALAAALAAALTVQGYFQASAGLREQAEAAIQSDGLVVVDAVDGWNSQRIRDLEMLARFPEMGRTVSAQAKPAEVAIVREALASMAASDPDVDSIGLLDKSGVFIASSNPADLGQKVAQRDYFRIAMDGSTFTSGVSISTITDKPAIFHSAPVRDGSGTVVGVVRSRAALSQLRAAIDKSGDRVGAGAGGVLLDDQGLIIHASFSPDWMLRPAVALSAKVQAGLIADKRWGKRAPPAPIGEADLAVVLGSKERRSFSWTTSGRKLHAMALPLQRTRWVYVAALPVATFERAAHLFLRSAGWSALLGLVIAALLAGIFAARVAAPIRRLTRASSKIVREGDLTGGVGVHARDEVGQLAAAFDEMVLKMRDILRGLKGASEVLDRAAQNLVTTISDHDQGLAQQASALQETQVTAQEIKQTSLLAAQKAEAVLKIAERADEVGREGETALGRSLDGIGDIRKEASQISTNISGLTERARQIRGITESVKDLADQSNMLALNAAIEAVRSGEHGKGFAVVAREIRSLADQSIQATGRVREILEELTFAIGEAVKIASQGALRMEGSAEQLRTSGESLRQLSEMVKENSAAVRQIAAAVSQQNAGIVQIFSAVTDQMGLMEHARRRIEQTTRAADEVKAVSREVSGIVAQYRI